MALYLPTPENDDPAGRPFQFGLRALFVATACLGALFAAMNVVGPVWSTILVWFLILASLHVVANAWGSRGWRRGDETELDEVVATGLHVHPPAVAPATHLRETTRLGWKMFVATTAGAALAGTLGAGCLACLDPDQVGYVAIAVGGVSAAVVGGFFGFLASSFLEVAGQAWREAVHGRPAAPALEAGEDALG